MAMSKYDLCIVSGCINVSLRGTGDVIEALCVAFRTLCPDFDQEQFLADCADGVTFKKEKLDVGDRVVCIAIDSGASYSVGDLGRVEEVDPTDDSVPYFIRWDSGVENWVYTWEVEHKP